MGAKKVRPGEALSHVDLIPNAEELISPFRVMALAVVTVSYFGFLDRAQFDESHTLPLLGIIATYCFVTLFCKPYRRMSQKISPAVFTVCDAIFVGTWALVTGGAKSPYFVIMYAGVMPVALRLNMGPTMLAALLYAVIYLLVLGTGGHSRVETGEIFIRIGLLFIVAGIAAVMATQIREKSLKLLAINRSLKKENLRRRATESDLRKKQILLSRADQRKDEFLAMLSHELRNPLASMYAAVALVEARDSSTELRSQATSTLTRQLNHLGRMVDDLLDVARVTEGKIVLQRNTADLYEILHESIEACSSELRRLGHHLHFNRPAREKIFLYGDQTRLEQVFTNLLSNAIKYTDPGGQIWILVSHNGAEVTARVKDSGMGMSQQMLDTAFDLFVQADSTLDRAHGGLGIGLTLAKELIEKHGGTIRATSDGMGCGSEFTVVLPIERVELEPLRADLSLVVDPRQAAANLAVFDGTPFRTLLVEDTPDVALLLRALLTKWGFEVSVATDGEMAVEMFRKVRPELVLLDIGLPKLDGFEVARQVRQGPGGTEAFIIALTGYGQPLDRTRAKCAGVDLHLTKPVQPALLKKILQEVPKQYTWLPQPTESPTLSS